MGIYNYQGCFGFGDVFYLVKSLVEFFNWSLVY